LREGKPQKECLPGLESLAGNVEAKSNRDERRGRSEKAFLEEGLAQARAESLGLELRVSIIRSGETESPHWQFRVPGQKGVLLHYWPAKGTWYDPVVGERGVYDNWEDALAHAAVRAECEE
jgi:hypothetical protein